MVEVKVPLVSFMLSLVMMRKNKSLYSLYVILALLGLSQMLP